MISRLRKVFVLLFTILIMLAGAFGWGIPSASAYQGTYVSSNHLLVNVSKHPHCPPPPYECY